jgi:hypothetical protein
MQIIYLKIKIVIIIVIKMSEQKLKLKGIENADFRNFQKIHIMGGGYQGTHYIDVYQFSVVYKHKLVCGIFKINESSTDHGYHEHIYSEKMYIVDASPKHGDVKTIPFLEEFETEDVKKIENNIRKMLNV